MMRGMTQNERNARSRAPGPREVLQDAARHGQRRARRRHLHPRRRDRRAAGPQRRRQVDDDRHAARARPAGRGQRVRVRPHAGGRGAGRHGRRDAPDRHADPGPVRARADRDGRVAVPRAARRRRGDRAGRDRGDRRPADAEALRRRDAARPLRARARQRPGAAGARRADHGDGRRGPPRLLGDDARVRLARPHDPLRHPLPRGGRRQRRPRRPDGRRPGRRRRPDDRDPGDGRRPHASARRCPTPSSSSSRTSPA